MGKSKAPQHIRDRRTGSQPSRRRATAGHWITWIVAGLGVLAAGFLVVGLFLNSLPRLSVGSSGSSRADDPMGTVFYLSNDGPLPVHDVTFGCGLATLGTANETAISGTGVTRPKVQQTAATLSPGHKLMLPCTHIEFGSSTVARIELVATYRPTGIWSHRTMRFPMEAKKSQSGEWIWQNQSN
jgi:hypothetical protein